MDWRDRITAVLVSWWGSAPLDIVVFGSFGWVFPTGVALNAQQPRGGMLGYGAVCRDVSPVSGAHSVRYDLALCALDTSVSTGTPYPPWYKVLAHRVVQSNPLSLSLTFLRPFYVTSVYGWGPNTYRCLYMLRVRRCGQASLTYLSSAAVLDLAQLVEVVAWWTLPNL